MATYRMTAPDGHDYEIDGPDGANDDQVRAQIIAQNPHLGQVARTEKPGALQQFKEDVTPPPGEGLLKTGLMGVPRAVGALAATPQRIVENTTGLGSGEWMGPAMAPLAKVYGYLHPPAPGRPEMDDRQANALGEQFAKLATDPLTYAGAGLVKGAVKGLGGLVRGAEAIAPEAAAVPRAAEALAPLKPAAEAHPTWPGAPGPSPEYVTQRSVVPGPTPWAGAPRAFEQAEDVIRARTGVNDFHAAAGTPSPVPPSISGGSAGPLGSETSALWNWLGEKTKPITGMDPKDWAIQAAKFKANVGTVFTPQDVARGIPGAESIVRDAYAAQDAAHLIVQDIGKKLVEIYKPFKGNAGAIEDIHRLLDGVPVRGVVTPELAVGAQRVRAVFDQLADMAGLPKQERLADYFPHLRDEISSVLQLKIGKEGQAIVKDIPQDFKVFFQKPRTLPGDETIDYGLKAVQGYLGAAAKRIAMKGGTLSDGRPVGGFLNRVVSHFENLPDVPELRSYFEEYVKDMAHGRQAGRTLLSPQTVQMLKQVEFLRTIGGNLMTPAQNLLQTMFTFSKVDPRSWGAAWYDILRNPELVAKARASGVVDQGYSHTDLLNLANPTKIQSLISKGADKAAILFQKSEEVNRMHAFAAGYRDAIRAGLPEQSALEHAKDIVNQTQFRFGPENMPGWLRQQGGMGSLVGQYKSYQLNSTMFIKNLLLHDPKGLAKFLGASVMLGGPDVFGSTAGHQLRKALAAGLGGDPKDYKWKGLLGEAGMWVGRQVGLGALPAEDLPGLAFLLPGPAVGHVMSGISAFTGKNYTAQALVRGDWGKDLNPDQRATNTVTSLPMGVQLNRLRQALVMGQSKGRVFQQPETTGQAYGLESPSGRGTLPYSEGEVVRKALGTPSEPAHEAQTQQQRVVEDVQAYKDLVNKKAAAIKRGDADAVRALNKEGVDRFGRIPAVRPNDVKKSVQGSRSTGVERAVRSAPKPIRQRERKEAED